MAGDNSHDAPGTTTTTSTDTTTFASRNPGKAVQEARGRKKGEPLSDGQKAERKEKAARRKVLAELLAEDIEAFCAYRSNLVVSLAAKHDKEHEYIKKLLESGSSFKGTHNISLRNTVMHHIRKTETIECPDSDSEEYDGLDSATIKKRKRAAVLLELHHLTDEALKEGFTPEEEEDMKEVLREQRKLKKIGLRASNVAAATDARTVAAHIQDEFRTLTERTGTRCFAFMTRGHCDDAAMPTFLHSGEAAAFCIEVIKKAPLDILRLYEQWACARSTENVQRDTTASLCTQISKLVEEKFHIIILNNTVRIDYVNMDVAIREKWRVEISGWPADINMVAPSKVKNIERLRRLRDGWVSGRICWVAMTAEQVAELTKKLDAVRDKNGGVVKTRKARSDTGGKRGKRVKAPRAVGKPGKKGPTAKSNTLAKKASKAQRRIEEEDEEEEDEDDDEEDEEDDQEADQEPPARPHHIPCASLPVGGAAPAASATGATAAPSDTTYAEARAPILLNAVNYAGPAAAPPSGSLDTHYTTPDTSAPIAMNASTTFIPYVPPAALGESTGKKRKASAEGGGATKKRKVPGKATAKPRPAAKPKAPPRRPGSGYKGAPKSAPGGVGGRADDTTARALQPSALRPARPKPMRPSCRPIRCYFFVVFT
ncbi:hypothetical protein GGX14DRAFT_572234 [Mycena pura]|uniref:Uncharacterized protein n=1 Tax=Mycena pura TaxID=153505 RepID=A0AAD6Y745_9AGAR|nr:hypothetical protein GGX14DRAFT_572234 [Mycena pura]